MNPAYDYRAAVENCALFDLTGRTVIEAAGPDARVFLHNLCTQDIKSLAVGETRESFLTTNKARVVAHVWIAQPAADVYLLEAVAGQAERMLAHLNRFLISEQVELADRTAEFGMLRIVGPKAEALLTATNVTPARRHRLLGIAGCDIVGPTSDIAGIRERLTVAGAVTGDAETYHTLRLEAGLPEYGIDIDENRLAMEVNRTAQAISYTKGCYLGQETIVMARDRGQVNRLLMGIKIATGEPSASDGRARLLPSLEPAGASSSAGASTSHSGPKLFRSNDEVGQITSSALSPRLGQVIALAYLRRGSWDVGTEVALDPATDGRTAVVCALPFCAGGESTLP